MVLEDFALGALHSGTNLVAYIQINNKDLVMSICRRTTKV